MKHIMLPNYSLKEEKLNTISHALGVFLALIGTILLGIKSTSSKSLICSLIFSISLFIMYLSSSVYHGINKKNKWKKIFRMIDHCNVFLLEIATFVPICFMALEKNIGITYFSILMILTIIGLILNYLILDKVQMFSVILHLVTGWSILILIPKLLENIDLMGVSLIIIGGALYTIGAVLYRLGRNYKYMHFVFHIFCLLGSISHFIMIYRYIL